LNASEARWSVILGGSVDGTSVEDDVAFIECC
jgi:hypothetical protein